MYSACELKIPNVNCIYIFITKSKHYAVKLQRVYPSVLHSVLSA